MEQLALWDIDAPPIIRAKPATYEEFVDKFKPKKTTDDCYTPPIVFDAIADWVAQHYELDKNSFVRPFYPGGDYLRYEYPEGSVVVDNPPFSILAQIVAFYKQENIKFFLFSPTLTLFSKKALDYTVLPCGADIIYENGADVNTSFVTNLEPLEVLVRTYPDLFQIIKQANAKNLKAQKRQLPKYIYPDYILTAAMAYRYAQYGVEYTLRRGECVQVDALDSQRAVGKAIFGKGLLLSERAAAEHAAAEHWELSDREWKIIKNLGGNDT